MTGRHGDELACAYCGTELEHGMDTIVTIAEYPGAVFCDRCESLARRNVTTPAAARRSPLIAGQVAIVVALVLLAIGSTLAIIAFASSTRP